MCLPFFLAGYFVPRSYDRKGLGHFPNQRWSRIGLPLLIFALAVDGPVGYLLAGRPPPGNLHWLAVRERLVPGLSAPGSSETCCSTPCTRSVGGLSPQTGPPAGLGRHPVTQQSSRSVQRNMIDELALRLVHGEYR
jgi:hypothetical protein